MHQFAEPGELLKEFEAEQNRLKREEEERKREEEKASAELIAQFEREQVSSSYNLLYLTQFSLQHSFIIKAEERARIESEQEKIRLADEALALELAEKEECVRKLRASTIVQTPPSSRKRPRKVSSDAKTTPAAKKINKFFTSNSSIKRLLITLFYKKYLYELLNFSRVGRPNSNENDEPSRSPSAFVPVTAHFQKSR